MQLRDITSLDMWCVFDTPQDRNHPDTPRFARIRIDAGYVVGFENSMTEPILNPGGALAENATLKAAGNSFQLAFSLGMRASRRAPLQPRAPAGRCKTGRLKGLILLDLGHET